MVGVCTDSFDATTTGQGSGYSGHGWPGNGPTLASHTDKGWLIFIRHGYGAPPRQRSTLYHDSAKHRWAGQKGAQPGDRVGLLLDLNQGSLAMYKNDVRIGVVVASGLPRGLCWCAQLQCGGSSQRDGGGAGVMIHNKPPPVVTEQDQRDDAERLVAFQRALDEEGPNQEEEDANYDNVHDDY